MSIYTCLFSKSNFEETYVPMWLASHLDIIESLKWMLDIATLIMRKII